MAFLEARITRRSLLTAIGLGAVSLVLPACGGGGDGSRPLTQPQVDHGSVGEGYSEKQLLPVGDDYCESGEGENRTVFKCDLSTISK